MKKFLFLSFGLIGLMACNRTLRFSGSPLRVGNTTLSGSRSILEEIAPQYNHSIKWLDADSTVFLTEAFAERAAGYKVEFTMYALRFDERRWHRVTSFTTGMQVLFMRRSADTVVLQVQAPHQPMRDQRYAWGRRPDSRPARWLRCCE